MQIVIDIPDNYYDVLKTIPDDSLGIERAIKHGTPLPKGHGRLIDVDKLELDDGYSNYDGYYHRYSREQICNAPIIIEADKAVKE